MVEEDRLKYQGSEEEKYDILNNFIYYDGDFLKLFELIPHLEFTESEEQRVYKIIDKELNNLQVNDSVRKSWEKYTKSRKTKSKTNVKEVSQKRRNKQRSYSSYFKTNLKRSRFD